MKNLYKIFYTFLLIIFICSLAIGQENTAILCADGIDNDGDGFADCDDTECITLPNLGCTTCFSDGLSFADSVLYYFNTCSNNTQTDSSKAIGVSDHEDGNIGYVSLGNEGVLILEFKNNVLTNSGDAAADLWIFEVGDLVESTFIELKPKDSNTLAILVNEGVTDSDGDGYYDFGAVAGATASIDIDNFLSLPYTPGSLLFGEVKLTDAPGNCSTSTPGADIDAVCALSSATINPQEVSAIDCSDGIDNDGDGLIDCDDTGCQALPNDGCTTCLGDGISFADKVNYYENTCPDNQYTNSSFALGVSDYSEDFTSFVSLGEGGVLILDFENNILTNSGTSDADLWVFEVGDFVESTNIELLPLDAATITILNNEGITDGDNDNYYDFGSIQGSTRALDIDGFLSVSYGVGSLQFTSIKLTDVPTTCGSENSPGADIDAVCALTSISTLPIELLSFTLHQDNENTVELLWTTSKEIDNEHFVIESSEDGVLFEEIGIISGAGNSNILNYYRFIDRNPHHDISYYRLKQVDFNGSYSLSDIKTIKLSDKSTHINISPNPFLETIFIESDEKIINIGVFNLQGELMTDLDLNDKDAYNLSGLAMGVYYILVQSSHQVTTKTIVKL